MKDRVERIKRVETAATEFIYSGQLFKLIMDRAAAHDASNNVSIETFERAILFATLWVRRQLTVELLPGISRLSTTKGGLILFRWRMLADREWVVGIGSAPTDPSVEELVEDAANKLREAVRQENAKN